MINCHWILQGNIAETVLSILADCINGIQNVALRYEAMDSTKLRMVLNN